MSNPLPEPVSDTLALRWESGDSPSLYKHGTALVSGVPMHTADQLRAHAAAEVAVARDCHTCKHYAVCLSPHHDGKHCANGDHYEPLPPVRLWRTA